MTRCASNLFKFNFESVTMHNGRDLYFVLTVSKPTYSTAIAQKMYNYAAIYETKKLMKCFYMRCFIIKGNFDFNGNRGKNVVVNELENYYALI